MSMITLQSLKVVLYQFGTYRPRNEDSKLHWRVRRLAIEQECWVPSGLLELKSKMDSDCVTAICQCVSMTYQASNQRGSPSTLAETENTLLDSTIGELPTWFVSKRHLRRR